MAKTVKAEKFDSKGARAGLMARGDPYYAKIGSGVHLGYRKGKKVGRWVLRYRDERKGQDEGVYTVETLADADDVYPANGDTVLDHDQAWERARKKHAELSGEDVIAHTYSIKEAIEEYLQWMESNRKSAKDARWRAEALIVPALGNKEVAKLKAKDIRDWLKKAAKSAPRVRTKKGAEQKFRELSDDDDAKRRRKASANRVLTILKAALNHAWRDGKVLSDAQWRRVEPFENADVARVRYLTVAEAKRLINASEPDFRKLVQAALQTGARYGEIAALRVEDFNPDAGTVHIRQSKTGSGRHVVLTAEGAEFFKGATAGLPGSQRLFSGPTGQAWGKSHQSRPMADACSNAKLSPPIGFHGLRHTWASHAVMNGVPLMVVARNLGHADTRMVEKHYGHLAPSYIADAIRAGAPRFGDSEPTNVVRMDAAK
ncbi:tyrosine-type recombinase/integrase [Mesorhizobium sp. ORM8.1]